jgi:hypothetical protein
MFWESIRQSERSTWVVPSRVTVTCWLEAGRTRPVSASHAVSIRWTVSSLPSSTFVVRSPSTVQNRWGKLYVTAIR